MNLSDAVEAVAIKTLVPVDLPDHGSNQHEVGGVGALREFFGTGAKVRKDVQWRYLADNREPEEDQGKLTFYDTRANDPDRSPEWRLYYTGEFLTRAEPDDVLVLLRTPSGEMYGLIIEHASALERAARHLFGTSEDSRYRVIPQRELEVEKLELPERLILESLGIELVVAPSASDEELVIERFVGDHPPTAEMYPSTAEMSALAREVSTTDAVAAPDRTLVRWIEREEELFRALEQVIVGRRLQQGLDEVDDFISYSLSVQNRRKSRMGHALQNQLTALFETHALRFDSQATTEGKNRPDFLFPGEDAYHDTSFPTNRLTMLGAKSTCKERWRQVLTEADRIAQKHLCTLEQGISENQTDEMSRQQLTLVLPAPLHDTYTRGQRRTLWTLDRFIQQVDGQQP